MKKRKLNSYQKQLTALKKKVSANKSDTMYFQSYGSFGLSSTAGYNEHWETLLPNLLTNNVRGDFVIEAVKFYLIAENVQSSANNCDIRVQLYSDQGKHSLASPVFVSLDQYVNPKQLKLRYDRTMTNEAGCGKNNLIGNIPLNLVVKRDQQSNTIEKNQHYLVVRWDQKTTATPQFRLGYQIAYREK